MKYAIAILLSLTSLNTLAESVSIHFSENNTDIKKLNQTPEQSYVSKDNSQKIDLKDLQDLKDVNELARSTELEVFTINEDRKIHTVFEHGGGICYGYLDNGVEITDSATYYVKDKSQEEYYSNISGGVVDYRGHLEKLQYASVFNIKDPKISKHLKEQDAKHGQETAQQNIKDRSTILSNVICNTPKKGRKK
ncbi:hypothetical protein [Lonepinella sp. MS14435]|uniref:hypothetical protein n=1 Tax=Lonepinella sp. MS14435 TaxID=3003618 RepID=UPI0036DBABFF